MHAVSTTASGRRRRGESVGLTLDPPEQLMEAFLNGDARAFERLFRQLSPRVMAALVHMSGDARLAEDLTQIVFLKLYRSRAGYQRGMLVMPWVFAIARNTFLDHRRHVRRRPESLSSDGTLPEPEPVEPSVIDRSAHKALYDVLQGLPSAQREALVLLKVQGLSLAEAAGLCGTSPASIKMRVHRAYRNIREALVSNLPGQRSGKPRP
jgi:RNA polymerase sigma-70 factor, ECF subfamily